ncbi:efflux RND transporter periplasmic adaptor subunit [Azotobacter vinelandii]
MGILNGRSSNPASGGARSRRPWRSLAAPLAGLALLAGCGETAAPPARPPTEVTAITLAARDTPVVFEFVAQTQSSREVEIRARVEGFLEKKRLYNEGDLVRTGQILFQMDPRPFEAALQSARGQLAQQQARLDMARADLGRIRPLVKVGALSKKKTSTTPSAPSGRRRPPCSPPRARCARRSSISATPPSSRRSPGCRASPSCRKAAM